jgi:hypothetical protein
VSEPQLPVPRWLGPIFIGLALITLAWIAVLWVTLPRRDVSEHYRVAWVGFDVFLAVALARTGWLALHGHDHVQLPAVASATLLVVDAWFDIVTASGRMNVLVALVYAALVELPLAAGCLWIARRAESTRRLRLAQARASAAEPPAG